MDGAWVDRLESRLGALAFPGLPGFLTAMTAGTALLASARPGLIERLALEPDAVLRGEVWRCLTFLIIPPAAHGLLWLALWLMLLYVCLGSLQLAWGDFKLTVYLLIGATASTAAALATGAPGDNGALHLSSFLAFARLAPERLVYVLFVIPMKLRWVAAVAAGFAAVQLAAGDAASRARLLAGLSAYILYFGPGHWRDLRRAWRRRGQA